MFHGLTYPWKALRALNQTPRLWSYVVIPIALSVILALALYGGVLPFAWRELGSITQPLAESALNWSDRLPQWLRGVGLLIESLLWLVRFALTIVLFWLLGMVLTQLSVLLGSPWYGQLSESLEQKYLPASLHGLPSPLSPWHDIRRSLQFELKKLAATAIVALLIVGFQFIPLLGQGVGTLLGGTWGFLLACLDFWDGPLERRRLGFRRKLSWILRQFPANLSFGCVASVMVSIPVLNLVTIPLYVAAGTLLVCDRLAKNPKV